MAIQTDRRTDDKMMPIADRLKIESEMLWCDRETGLKIKHFEVFLESCDRGSEFQRVGAITRKRFF